MTKLNSQHARAVWSQKLVTYYFVDVNMLTQAIHNALPVSSRAATPPEHIAAMLTNDLAVFPERAAGWYRTVGTREFLGILLFVRRYSRWMKSLGASLGHDVDAMLMEDDWVDSLPEVQPVLWGLMDRVRADLQLAQAITDVRGIEAAFQVVIRSVDAGEHPHQTFVRGERATQGLRLVG
ncbi:hypothetical protein QO021_28750 (plasmid) [Pseudomonas amygdali pv. lachrymans]|uniref:hypothetical protein n=1 Tax=Pseudomonas amygdali TaxID=47877 RepID=UPI0006B96C07|nr:hypothetical protein [Pseudomonas amygdali]RMM39247.1 hypothetical protein ALQ79_200008 [Pseudomonas amygdali pv. lachrymans]WIO61549.1 hypothetical protein QO021_28750 [Pseudomonas amygdali pv. lachrymans]